MSWLSLKIQKLLELKSTGKDGAKNVSLSDWLWEISFSLEQQLVRPHQIYGKIQTTFQIKYNGHYFPNPCIQCNLFITLLFQLEFILGLGSEFKSEGLRIWHGQDLCKKLPVSFASCEESDSEESYTCYKKCVIFWLFIYNNTYWTQYFLL